ncbi:MAG: efflux RND transporter periplasmic adaptor subunit [Betaproteobacteria bacterium]|nr:efflux RND transporter periplasmic adaptor subunit [Betaproteobacteria bacterium]
MIAGDGGYVSADMNEPGAWRIRTALIIVLVLVLGGVVWAKRARLGAEAAAQPVASPTQPVIEFSADDLLTVTPAELRRTVPFSGSLIAVNTALVKVKVAGELLAVTVRQGEPVRAGQVVARVDPTDVQARVNARSADLEVARAQLQLSEKNRDTQRVLLEKNFISKNTFDSTQSGYEVALARLHVAEAELVSARKALGDAVLYAPLAGIVAERFAEPGERVAVDARVLSIVDLSRLEIEASLPASAIGAIGIGQEAGFAVDGFGERRFQGRVTRISPVTAVGTRSVAVYVAIENLGNALRAGLFVKGELLVSRVANALTVPAFAVRQERNMNFVYAIEGNALARRAVVVERDGPDAPVRIVSGLAAGDRIVRGNLGTLREGASVRVRGAEGRQP